jgi:hypothetical protein
MLLRPRILKVCGMLLRVVILSQISEMAARFNQFCHLTLSDIEENIRVMHR